MHLSLASILLGVHPSDGVLLPLVPDLFVHHLALLCCLFYVDLSLAFLQARGREFRCRIPLLPPDAKQGHHSDGSGQFSCLQHIAQHQLRMQRFDAIGGVIEHLVSALDGKPTLDGGSTPLRATGWPPWPTCALTCFGWPDLMSERTSWTHG